MSSPQVSCKQRVIGATCKYHLRLVVLASFKPTVRVCLHYLNAKCTLVSMIDGFTNKLLLYFHTGISKGKYIVIFFFREPIWNSHVFPVYSKTIFKNGQFYAFLRNLNHSGLLWVLRSVSVVGFARVKKNRSQTNNRARRLYTFFLNLIQNDTFFKQSGRQF